MLFYSRVEENLLALGWERITDKSREDFKLKWCEIKSHNNYHSFREGIWSWTLEITFSSETWVYLFVFRWTTLLSNSKQQAANH